MYFINISHTSTITSIFLLLHPNLYFPMLIDTHAHIYAEEFNDDIDEMLQRAFNEGVGHIFMPNIDTSSIEAMHILEDRYAQCHSMLGLHPCYVKDDYTNQLDIIERTITERKPFGIGEVGIDLYWDKTFVAEQVKAFEIQIQWARELDLPVIIHSRDSLDLTIETISRYQNGSLKGIFHCFNGTVEQGKRIQDLGFMTGLGGVVTYKNSGMDQVIPHLNLKFLVLETDAPYLSPVPHRGKRNEVKFIRHVANKCAEILEMESDELDIITSNNAMRLFGV
jgi:TatD DNase family protein